MDNNKVIRAGWEDDKDKTEIYLEKKWKEMIDWASKIPAFKDNVGLPCHLIIAVPKKKDIVNRLKTQ